MCFLKLSCAVLRGYALPEAELVHVIRFPQSISAEAQAALRRPVNADGMPLNALHSPPHPEDIDGWMRFKAAVDAQHGAAMAQSAGQLRASVPCELHIFETMPHGGFMGAPEDREPRAEVARFVRAHLQECELSPETVAQEMEYRFCGPATYRLRAISRSFSRNWSNALSIERSSEPASGCRFRIIASSIWKVISRELS